MTIKRQPSGFAVERWMRMPGIPTSLPSSSKRELFAFSGYADFTADEQLPTLIPTDSSTDSPTVPGPLEGGGLADTEEQELWVEYDIEQMVVGPHWRAIDGVCPVVVIGGHSQVSPDVADAMGFRVQGITKVDSVSLAPGANRIRLSVNVAVRGGLDGKILTLAYQVTAFGMLSIPMSNEGVFFAGSSDPT
ncbi:MAG: hypothetical protein WCD39_00395 [Methyloceanibacter sp.]